MYRLHLLGAPAVRTALPVIGRHPAVRPGKAGHSDATDYT